MGCLPRRLCRRYRPGRRNHCRLAVATLAIAALAVSALAAIGGGWPSLRIGGGPVGLAVGIDRPVIMLGVLEIVLHGDAIAGQARVARQGQVLLHHLVGIAADRTSCPGLSKFWGRDGLCGLRGRAHAIAGDSNLVSCSLTLLLDRDPRLPDPSCVPKGIARHIDGVSYEGVISSPLDIRPRRRVPSDLT